MKRDTEVESIITGIKELKKKYNNEVHKTLLGNIRSKLELKAHDNMFIGYYY